MRGRVAWFDNGKGFGFIEPKGGGEDVFVHHTAIQMDGYRKLDQGDLVEFGVEKGQSGRTQACDVRKVED